MAALEVLALNEVTSQIRAPGVGDTYIMPRPVAIAGSITLTGGIVTTPTPVLNATQTWNAGLVTFTGIKFNVTDTASASASLLMDLQVGGISKLSFSKTNILTAGTSWTLEQSGGSLGVAGPSGGNGIVFYLQGGSSTTNSFFNLSTAGATLPSSRSYGWASGTDVAAAQDAGLARVAAGVIKVTNGSIGAGVIQTPALTVATLPAAATAGAGARSFVTDATATTFLSTVAGGGVNKVPVVSDGTNWLIG